MSFGVFWSVFRHITAQCGIFGTILLLIFIGAILYCFGLVVSLIVSEIVGALLVAYMIKKYHSDRYPTQKNANRLWLTLVSWVHNSTGIYIILF